MSEQQDVVCEIREAGPYDYKAIYTTIDTDLTRITVFKTRESMEVFCKTLVKFLEAPIDEIYPPEVIKKYCDELSPEDVFSSDKLEDWARDAGWVLPTCL